MQTAAAATERFVSQSHHGHSTIALIAAAACLIWYATVALVCTIGYVQLWRHYSSPAEHVKPTDLEDEPHVTVIRPVKGLEPSMYDCLASTFRQVYPNQKLSIRFCVSERRDAAFPILERLVREFPDFDARIMVEEEDVALQNGSLDLGPNPKIRNMSRAYRKATGDIVWIIDCNVWVGKHTCGRMVQRLGYSRSGRKNKFIHQLPLVVDTFGTTAGEEMEGRLDGIADAQIRTTSTAGQDTMPLKHQDRTIWSVGGGRLEEIFMSSSHAKFYTAINTVLIAPCAVGKSTMFRRSNLDSLTRGQGIDYFSRNICEDHLIGDLLWKHKVPQEKSGEKFGKHALCFGDLAVQPMSNMSVDEYWSRRVRWLRVRKFTVTLATLVEPGTESFLCSLYGAFAVTTLPIFRTAVGVPSTWPAFFAFWFLSVTIWCIMDWTLYQKLHSASSIPVDEHTPSFARGRTRRRLREWLLAWLGRETLALPIWLWAFYGGTRVEWRGRKFWVGMDMTVHEITDSRREKSHANGHVSRGKRKDRWD